MIDIAIIILAYFILPLSSLLFYIKLVRRMKAEGVFKPPVFSLFFVMLSYTVLILNGLSIFASFGDLSHLLFYPTVIIQPILTFIIACAISDKRDFSAYHNGIYLASLIYILAIPFSIFLFTMIIFIW